MKKFTLIFLIIHLLSYSPALLSIKKIISVNATNNQSSFHPSIPIDLIIEIDKDEYSSLATMLEEDILPSTLRIIFHESSPEDKKKVINLLTDAGYISLDKNANNNLIFTLDETLLTTYRSISQPHTRGIKITIGKFSGPPKLLSKGMHAYRVKDFEHTAVKTEYNAYKLLKEHPIDNVSYVAIPWVHLIKMRRLNRVPNIKLKGEAFTICQHIRYAQILPHLERIGINVLFTPHASKNKETYKSIKILPFPFNAVNGINPAPQKDLLYSFIGYNTHYTRNEIFTIPTQDNALIKKRSNWHFHQNKTQEEQEQEKKEYQDALARSRFSLCPRGTGAGTIRFWESLQAGAIPVLISDDVCLPEGEIDWDKCIIRIAEEDVDTINDLLNSIPPEKEKEMRENCLKAYTLFSGKNLVRTIREYYANEALNGRCIARNSS